MTKNAFKNYTNEYTFCESCKRSLPTSNFSYSYIKIDGTASRCNYCDWLKRHDGIPEIDGYTNDQIKMAVEFIVLNKLNNANDLALGLNLTLDATIDLVQKLRIGNKRFVVKSNCSYCGKEIENNLSVYKKSNNLYCSYECYWNHKPETVGRGKNNICYSRIKTKCTYCGKEIEVIPYDYNKKNLYGDSHNFCSQDCYWKYRKLYYVGERSANYKRVFTDSQREKMRENLIKNARNAKRFDSKIQLCINDILDKNHISYKREYIIKYYAIDNYLTDFGLMIEVMGDYWHSSPLKYNSDKYQLNEMQAKWLLHDKQKHTYITNHNKIEILYLWEHDINNNIKLCEELILNYIHSNGQLDNYHSFNWEYINNELKLKSNIIIPYQNMEASAYKHLIKKKAG